MRAGLISVLVATAGLLGTVDETGAAQCTLGAAPSCNFPNPVATLDGNVSPQRLPAKEYVPVRWGVFGKIATRDGTHPSALREIVLDVDKDVRINSRDYPTCKQTGRTEPLTTKEVEKACKKALVGRGKALVEVAFPGNAPMLLSSGLLVVNGGKRGDVTKLLIHLFIPVPRPTAIVTEVRIMRKVTGLHTVAKIPVIAGGSGSLLDFKFKIGNTYSYKGKKYGYFEAKCPDGVFKANVSKLLFKNEARVPGVAAQTVMKGGFAVPCTPKS